jgi:hypothetical protein
MAKKDTAALAAERKQLLAQVLALRKDRIQELLRRHEQRRSGTRAELREVLEGAVAEGEISTEDIVSYLDEVEPWGKQHVFLYSVPQEINQAWMEPAAIRNLLAAAGVADLLDESVSLALPEEMTLSSVRLADEAIEIVAVEQREFVERDQSLDRVQEGNVETIEYRAFIRRRARGLIILRWTPTTALASLHVSQAHRGYEYEESARQFAAVTKHFLDFKRFARTDLRRAVVKLRDREQNKGGPPLARSQRVGFQSSGEREIDITSPSTDRSVVGETAIDQAIDQIASNSRGRLGNVFWLTKDKTKDASNPLADELHTTIVASESRIHFRVPTSSEAIRYVIRQIRGLC